jgi:hypothetical protein
MMTFKDDDGNIIVYDDETNFDDFYWSWWLKWWKNDEYDSNDHDVGVN